jgi:hypothetical protein
MQMGELLGWRLFIKKGHTGSQLSWPEFFLSASPTQQQSAMQDLAAVFIALSLLLSPLTIDRNGANNSASGDGAMTLTQQAEHSESGYHANGPVVSSIEGGGMSATTTEDKDNSDCPIKYPDPNSKAYCECVVDRTDNFVCNVRVSRLVSPTRIKVLQC